MTRIAIAAALVASAALPALAEPETFNVDPRHTFPTYEVSHFGLSMQRGRFNRSSGKIMLDEAAGKCSASIAVDAASVSSGVDKLDEHLRSEDFFDVARHPQILFATGDCTFEGGKLAAARGELTIRGVTRPVTLVAQLFHCGPHPVNKRKACGADFETTIRRSEFGMKYALPALGDDVRLRIGVEAVKE